MIFLVVFLCCVFELNYVSFAPLRRGRWILSWHKWLCDNFALQKFLGSGALLVSIAIPCALLAYLFSNIFISSVFLTFVGGTAVLLYCCGPGDIAQEIETYTRNYLDEHGNQSPPDAENFLINIESSEGDPDRPFLRAIAVEANDRLFAPVFWFCILGPVGALLFRMTLTMKRAGGLLTAEAGIAERLYGVLVWLPARLFAIGLGLGGTLGPVIGVIGERCFDLTRSNAVLGDAAIVALDQRLDDEADQHTAAIGNMFSLVKRGFVVWLAILALLVVAGVL